MSEKPTIDELRAEWDKAVLEISAARSWQSAAAMRDTAYGKAKRLIASLEAHAADQQQRIDELEAALNQIFVIAIEECPNTPERYDQYWATHDIFGYAWIAAMVWNLFKSGVVHERAYEAPHGKGER